MAGGSAAEDGWRVRGAHVNQRGVGRPAPVGGVGSLARRAGTTTVFVVLQGSRWRCFHQQDKEHQRASEIAARLSMCLISWGFGCLNLLPGLHVRVNRLKHSLLLTLTWTLAAREAIVTARVTSAQG